MERIDLMTAPTTRRLTSDHGEGHVDVAEIIHNDSAQLNVVHFYRGARTKWHIHTEADQYLCWLAGNGSLGTAEGTFTAEAGELFRIAAGEKHWHGARRNQDATHLSVVVGGPGSRWFDEVPDPVD